METVKVKTEAKYFSHNVKKNKSIDLVVTAPYSELQNYIQTIQMLNEDIDVVAKIGADKKSSKLGVFKIQNITIDNDGEGKIKLNSQLDFVETQNIDKLAMRNDEPLKLMFKCEIEVEEDEEDEEEEEDE